MSQKPKDVKRRAAKPRRNNDFAEVTHEIRTRPEKKPWRKVIYTKETGEFFGRTGMSWARLGLFYVVFYGVLAALCAVCMEGLFATLTTEYPKWQLDESRIGTNPGLAFRPIPDDSDEVYEISYRSSDLGSTKVWVDLLDKFLLPYQNTSMNHTTCKPSGSLNPGQICTVNLNDFGPCSSALNYGYNSSSPCVFLKLNRIYGWKPQYYNEPEDLPGEMSDHLKTVIGKLPKDERDQVWVSCSSLNDIGQISYFPGQGFPGQFYPYMNTPGYLSPLVAVKIENSKVNQTLNVECRAWAKNIHYQTGKKRTGSVQFQLVIN